MDILNNMFNSGFSLDAILKTSDLDRRVQKHVQKVYLTLTISVIVCALGVLTDMVMNIGGIFTAFMGFGLVIWLGSTPSTSNSLPKRYGLLLGISFLQGLSMGNLVNMVLDLNPSIVLSALLMTTAVFVSFTLGAVVAKRRSMLFLYSLCSAGASGLLVLSFVNMMIGGSIRLLNVELYLGLIVFSVYVIVDTQMIVERASAGEFDHIKDALNLFLNFINIFIRILVILAKKEEKKDEKKRRS